MNYSSYFEGFLTLLPSQSLLPHTSDINDLLKCFDGVLEDWLDGLHDPESPLHIIDLRLHSFDCFHLPGNFDQWLAVVQSLKYPGRQRLLDILDRGGLRNRASLVVPRLEK